MQSLAFHPDGLTLASAGRNEARFWDVASGNLILRIEHASAGGSRALCFNSEGRRLIFGGEPGAGAANVGLWELESHRGIQVLRGLASSVRKVWFSANSQRAAALSDDWNLAVWEVGSGRLLSIFETPVGVLADNAGGCFDISGERFAFATGREACLYNLETSRVLRQWRLNNGLSDQLQFDARGRLLLLRRERASEQLRNNWRWRLHELGTPEKPVLLHEQTETNWSALDTALPAGGERFLVWNGGPAGTTRIIRAYDAASGRQIWQAATEQTHGDLRVCVDPTGRWFGHTTDASARLRLMDFLNFKEIGTTAGHYQAISPSGREFAGNAQFFPDLTGAKHAVPLITDWQSLSYVSAFSPNGKLLTWGTVEGVVLVADIQTVLSRLSSLGKGHVRR